MGHWVNGDEWRRRREEWQRATPEGCGREVDKKKKRRTVKNRSGREEEWQRATPEGVREKKNGEEPEWKIGR